MTEIAFKNIFVIPQDRAGRGEARAETTSKQDKSEFNPVAGVNTDKSGNALHVLTCINFIL